IFSLRLLSLIFSSLFFFFFFTASATTEIYTLSLHDALPISTLLETTHPFFYKLVPFLYPFLEYFHFRFKTFNLFFRFLNLGFGVVYLASCFTYCKIKSFNFLFNTCLLLLNFIKSLFLLRDFRL